MHSLLQEQDPTWSKYIKVTQSLHSIQLSQTAEQVGLQGHFGIFGTSKQDK